MKQFLVAASAIALLTAPVVALAQTSTTSPATSSSSAKGGTMSEAQIKQKLEKEGYSNIELKRESSTSASGSSTPSAAQPEYTGTAKKNGKTVNIMVNSEGELTEK
jgi:opacity protein-like surface antigen